MFRCFRPGFSVRGSWCGSTEDFRWDGTDRILREEFNSNWEKLDTQLKALADQGSSLQTALPKITSGTYTHATAQMKQDAADAIGGVISQQMR